MSNIDKEKEYDNLPQFFEFSFSQKMKDITPSCPVLSIHMIQKPEGQL